MWPEGYTPGRADYICLSLIGLSALYGLVIMVTRPMLLGFSPLLLSMLSGSRSALVTIGAMYETGGYGPVAVAAAFVVSSVSLIKLDLLFWWAGRLWGDFFLKSLVGPSERARRRAARAEKLARRYALVAVVVTNIPVLPIPRTIVFAVLGISRTRFRTVFAVDLAAAAVVQGMWLYLGYSIGQPVVDVVEVIARYSLWISLVILAVVLFGSMRKAKQDAARESGA